MPVIAVDAMGGDFAPDEVVKGVARASLGTAIECVLVGDEQRIQKILESVSYNPEHISIRHAAEFVEMHEPPKEALRAKRDASIVVGAKLVAEGHAQHRRRDGVDANVEIEPAADVGPLGLDREHEIDHVERVETGLAEVVIGQDWAIDAAPLKNLADNADHAVRGEEVGSGRHDGAPLSLNRRTWTTFPGIRFCRARPTAFSIASILTGDVNRPGRCAGGRRRCPSNVPCKPCGENSTFVRSDRFCRVTFTAQTPSVRPC